MNYKIENGIAGPIITFNDDLKQETYFDIPSDILNVIKGLEQENQKYKEVINRSIETMESWLFALDYAECDRLRIIMEILK